MSMNDLNETMFYEENNDNKQSFFGKNTFFVEKIKIIRCKRKIDTNWQKVIKIQNLCQSHFDRNTFSSTCFNEFDVSFLFLKYYLYLFCIGKNLRTKIKRKKIKNVFFFLFFSFRFFIYFAVKKLNLSIEGAISVENLIFFQKALHIILLKCTDFE